MEKAINGMCCRADMCVKDVIFNHIKGLDVSDFSSRLRLAREHFGHTQSTAAAANGLKDRNTWVRYESGKTRPDADILRWLHDQGVDINWLLTGEGVMLRGQAAPPDESTGAGAQYTQADRLYEIAIRTTLAWYDDAELELAPEKMAAMITLAVRDIRSRLIRSRRPLHDCSDDDLAAEVTSILDIARDMAANSGWKPK